MVLLLKQLDELLATLSLEGQGVTLSTLNRIFSNSIQHPGDDKFCQIKLANEAFTSKVWQYPAGEELMMMSGWVVEGDCVKLQNDLSTQIALAVTSQKLKVCKQLASYIAMPYCYLHDSWQ